MNDNEYVNFVKENENKPLSEIMPENLRKTVMDALAKINPKKKASKEATVKFIFQIRNLLWLFLHTVLMKQEKWEIL